MKQKNESSTKRQKIVWGRLGKYLRGEGADPIVAAKF